jgi:hypothetical protein
MVPQAHKDSAIGTISVMIIIILPSFNTIKKRKKVKGTKYPAISKFGGYVCVQ